MDITNLSIYDIDCSICLEQNEIKSVTMPLCGHIFHEKCIKDWLEIKNNCPICRQIAVHITTPPIRTINSNVVDNIDNNYNIGFSKEEKLTVAAFVAILVSFVMAICIIYKVYS